MGTLVLLLVGNTISWIACMQTSYALMLFGCFTFRYLAHQ